MLARYLLLVSFLVCALFLQNVQSYYSAFHVSTIVKASRSTTQRFSLRLYNKIKVKLLVDVKGQGKKGDIIVVSPSLWTNVLQPTKQGRAITDEEIAMENKLKIEKENTILKQAQSVAIKIEALKEASKIVIRKKAGANGQLFGTVTKKNILESLKGLAKLELDTIDEKSVSIQFIKVIDIASEAGAKGSEVEEIRKLGLYEVSVHLNPKVNALCQVEVAVEK
jgi:large subunit ribosomal protein L9